MTMRRPLAKWLVILGVLHAIVVCAGFFAPYDPIEQDRKNPYLPPMPLHLLDAQGHLHLRPFAYAPKLREGTFDQYEQDTSQSVPMKFFRSGAGYRLLGFLPSRIHLFGSEDARICLLGTDAYGRDQFSRLLYGGQISVLAGLLGPGCTLSIGFWFGRGAGVFGGWGGGGLLRGAGVFFGMPWV